MARDLEQIMTNIERQTLVRCDMAGRPKSGCHALVTKPAVDDLARYASYARNLVHKMRQEAIELGYAQYNPKTGVFEWIRKDGQDVEKGN